MKKVKKSRLPDDYAKEMREARDDVSINLPPVVNKSTGEVLPRVKTQLTAYLYEKDFEKNLEPSMTKPGQSMTIQEMVARHRKGLPIDQSKGALYQGEDLLPNLDDMDLVDRANYMDSVADYLVETRARLAANAKTEEEKSFLKKVDEEVRIRIAEMNRPAVAAGTESQKSLE